MAEHDIHIHDLRVLWVKGCAAQCCMPPCLTRTSIFKVLHGVLRHVSAVKAISLSYQHAALAPARHHRGHSFPKRQASSVNKRPKGLFLSYLYWYSSFATLTSLNMDTNESILRYPNEVLGSAPPTVYLPWLLGISSETLDANKSQPRRRHRIAPRSVKGCSTCKGRSKKCDETRPKCGACSRLDLDCVWNPPSRASRVPKAHLSGSSRLRVIPDSKSPDITLEGAKVTKVGLEGLELMSQTQEPSKMQLSQLSFEADSSISAPVLNTSVWPQGYHQALLFEAPWLEEQSRKVEQDQRGESLCGDFGHIPRADIRSSCAPQSWHCMNSNDASQMQTLGYKEHTPGYDVNTLSHNYTDLLAGSQQHQQTQVLTLPVGYNLPHDSSYDPSKLASMCDMPRSSSFTRDRRRVVENADTTDAQSLTLTLTSGRRLRSRVYKSHQEVTTGCLTCRSRKVKCDETHPDCSGCISLGRICIWPSLSKSARPRDAELSVATESLHMQGNLPGDRYISPGSDTGAAKDIDIDGDTINVWEVESALPHPIQPASRAEIWPRDDSILSILEPVIAVGAQESIPERSLNAASLEELGLANQNLGYNLTYPANSPSRSSYNGDSSDEVITDYSSQTYGLTNTMGSFSQDNLPDFTGLYQQLENQAMASEVAHNTAHQAQVVSAPEIALEMFNDQSSNYRRSPWSHSCVMRSGGMRLVWQIKW